MAGQHISNMANVATGGGASVLPALPSTSGLSGSAISGASTAAGLSSSALPSLPPPTVGTALGIAATAVAASSLLQPGQSTLTGMATTGLFASSLKNLVLPSGTTLPQQQDSLMKGALGLAAVAVVSAMSKKDSKAEAEAEAAAAQARAEAKKAQDEAAAARRAAEERAFLWAHSNQPRAQISQTELQMALQMRAASSTQRDSNKA